MELIVVIREADVLDAATIAAIHEAAVLGERGHGCYRDGQIEAWALRSPVAKLSSPRCARQFFLLSESQVARAYAQLDLECGVLRSLYVMPQCQHRGFGQRLVDRLLTEATSAGLERLELDASLNSVAFYEALGFSRMGEAAHELGNGVVLPCEHMFRELV